jgi:hypothetical protein
MTETLDEASMPRSPGGIMRSAREKAGVHLGVLSVNLKVSIKQLEALEADQFQHWPEPVFARALAAKVCRFLRIDSEPVLALMPRMTNGLKPLQLIESDNRPSNRLHRMDLPSGTHPKGRKPWIFFQIQNLRWLTWFPPCLRFKNKQPLIQRKPICQRPWCLTVPPPKPIAATPPTTQILQL